MERGSPTQKQGHPRGVKVSRAERKGTHVERGSPTQSEGHPCGVKVSLVPERPPTRDLGGRGDSLSQAFPAPHRSLGTACGPF